MGCIPSRVRAGAVTAAPATTATTAAAAALTQQAAPSSGGTATTTPTATAAAIATEATTATKEKEKDDAHVMLTAGDDGVVDPTQLASYLDSDVTRCVVVLFGNVYDVTAYVARHPGGVRVLRTHSGRECGETFLRLHGPRARTLAVGYYVGRLAGATLRAPASLTPSSSTAEHAKATTATAAAAGTVVSSSSMRVQSTRLLHARPSSTSGRAVCLTFATPQPLSLVPGGYVVFYRRASPSSTATAAAATATTAKTSDDSAVRSVATASQGGRAYALYESNEASFSVCVRRSHHHSSHNGHDDDGDAIDTHDTDLCALQPGDEVFFAGPYAPRWNVTTWHAQRTTAAAAAAAATTVAQSATTTTHVDGDDTTPGHPRDGNNSSRAHGLLDDDGQRVLLVGAGVGVAPLMAVARYVLHTLRLRVILVCVHRSPHDTVLDSELAVLQRANAHTTRHEGNNKDDDNSNEKNDNKDNDNSNEKDDNNKSDAEPRLTLVYVYTRGKAADAASGTRRTRRTSSSSSSLTSSSSAPQPSPSAVIHTFDGYLTAQMLRSAVASPALVAVLCGPHAFTQATLQCIADSSVCAREDVHVL